MFAEIKITMNEALENKLALVAGSFRGIGAVITTPQDVDSLEFDWGKIHFLVEPLVTNAERFSFGIVELAAGQGHARHNHPASEERHLVGMRLGETATLSAGQEDIATFATASEMYRI